MKRFACGDVVPGCTATWTESTEEQILAAVSAHARADHDMADIPDEVVDQVRANIHDVD